MEDAVKELREKHWKICADCKLFKEDVDIGAYYCDKVKSWVSACDIVEGDNCFEIKKEEEKL